MGLKTYTDDIYDVILQREGAYSALGELRNADTDLGVNNKLLIFQSATKWYW